MRKVVIHRPGSYDRLIVEEHSDPAPANGETLVDVEAIGVNYADCVVRMGLYESASEYVGWPITPGFEVAGSDAASGEEVLAVTRFGGYASRIAVPSHQVFPAPRGWTTVQAAGLPTVFLTAWYALVHCAATHEGQTVLVHSAAGGVGGALLQLARIHGARAIGIVGASHKVEVARALGAHDVVDRSEGDLWRAIAALAPGGFDAVFESTGVATLRRSYRCLRPTGRLVVFGHASMLPRGRGKPSWPALAWRWLRLPRFNPLAMTNDNKSVMAFNLSYLFDERETLARAMQDVLGWAGEGKIRPLPVKTYPMDGVADAHRDLESGATVGKLVLIP